MEELTWTCHICKEERPDSKISVYTRNRTMGPVEFQENIRHCNDKSSCISGAEHVTFVGNVADD